MASRVFLLWVSLLPLACGDDGSVTTTDPSTGGATGDSTGGSTDPGSDATGDASTGEEPSTTGSSDDGPLDTGDTGFDPPVPACGNGYVEADEECDDGNAVDDDGCSNACQVPCGLQWSTVALGPTPQSEIEGLSITRDAARRIVVSGRLREITVEMDGTEIEGDDTVLVQSYDPTGSFDWAQVLGTPDGDALPAGVAVDAMGDVYVAATLDTPDGGTAIQAIKLAASDGGTLWIHDFDGPFPGEDELAFGIAVGPDGQPVISGQVRAGDGDDDVWVRKLEAADGAEVWTETYSGVASGGFSTDDGGPVAIGPDGSIFVLARIYESFDTIRGTLLRFGPDGGPPTWTFTPTIGGANQSFTLEALAVGADGGPAMAVSRPQVGVSGWLFRLDDQGQEVWSRTHQDFAEPRRGSDWRFEGLAFTGDELVVLGRYVNDQSLPGSAWWEPSVVRVAAADASVRCRATHTVDDESLIPPSLRSYAVATASDGSALVTGQQEAEQELALWLGSFRP